MSNLDGGEDRRKRDKLKQFFADEGPPVVESPTLKTTVSQSPRRLSTGAGLRTAIKTTIKNEIQNITTKSDNNNNNNNNNNNSYSTNHLSVKEKRWWLGQDRKLDKKFEYFFDEPLPDFFPLWLQPALDWLKNPKNLSSSLCHVFATFPSLPPTCGAEPQPPSSPTPIPSTPRNNNNNSSNNSNSPDNNNHSPHSNHNLDTRPLDWFTKHPVEHVCAWCLAYLTAPHPPLVPPLFAHAFRLSNEIGSNEFRLNTLHSLVNSLPSPNLDMFKKFISYFKILTKSPATEVTLQLVLASVSQWIFPSTVCSNNSTAAATGTEVSGSSEVLNILMIDYDTVFVEMERAIQFMPYTPPSSIADQFEILNITSTPIPAVHDPNIRHVDTEGGSSPTMMDVAHDKSLNLHHTSHNSSSSSSGKSTKYLVVKSGLAKALITKMIDWNYQEKNFIEVLLFTHSYFLTSLELLDNLIKMYKKNDPIPKVKSTSSVATAVISNNSNSQGGEMKWQHGIRMRILYILRKWVVGDICSGSSSRASKEECYPQILEDLFPKKPGDRPTPLYDALLKFVEPLRRLDNKSSLNVEEESAFEAIREVLAHVKQQGVKPKPQSLLTVPQAPPQTSSPKKDDKGESEIPGGYASKVLQSLTANAAKTNINHSHPVTTSSHDKKDVELSPVKRSRSGSVDSKKPALVHNSVGTPDVKASAQSSGTLPTRRPKKTKEAKEEKKESLALLRKWRAQEAKSPPVDDPLSPTASSPPNYQPQSELLIPSNNTNTNSTAAPTSAPLSLTGDRSQSMITIGKTLQKIDTNLTQSLRVLSLPPALFARLLTKVDDDLFIQIPLHELQHQRFLHVDSSPYFFKLVDRFNYIASWATSFLLSLNTTLNRARGISWIIEVIHLCIKKLLNLNTAMALISALLGTPVARLKKTWSKVGRRWKKKWKKMREYGKPDRNYVEYRMLVMNIEREGTDKVVENEENTNGERIHRKKKRRVLPYLALVSQDLNYLEEGNPTLVSVAVAGKKEEEKVNVEKLRLLWEIGRMFKTAQMRRKEMFDKYFSDGEEGGGEITAEEGGRHMIAFAEMNLMTDDEQYESSLAHEPREKK